MRDVAGSILAAGPRSLKKKKMSTAFTLQTWARPSRGSADDHVKWPGGPVSNRRRENSVLN